MHNMPQQIKMHILFYEQSEYERGTKIVKFYLMRMST